MSRSSPIRHGEQVNVKGNLITRSQRAEKAKDVNAFLALWTDKGLEAYDQGSREDLKAGPIEVPAKLA